MGANIYFRQIKPAENKYLSISHRSTFLEQLEDTFGSFPVRLTEANVSFLHGMAAINDDFEKVITIIEQYGEIEIWPEY